jgi:hypothetical protein
METVDDKENMKNILCFVYCDFWRSTRADPGGKDGFACGKVRPTCCPPSSFSGRWQSKDERSTASGL